ncbi:transcription factor che-1-like [Ornithodoros turicata]|uniref:transcription factor che-1-like n=1 Tax=Ornithodoros turicata TaxID=34597 RepID=UPI003138CF67
MSETESSKSTVAAEKPKPTGKFRCKYCPFASDEKSLVRWHQSKHPKEKPLVCPICNKSYMWRSSMAAHRQSHTGERPYKCSNCSRGFTSSTNLARHLKACPQKSGDSSSVDDVVPERK